MKRVGLPLVLVLVLLAVSAQAAYENSSVVGQVPDRVLVTVDAGVTVNLDKSGPQPLFGVAALDELGARFAIENITPLYAGMTNHIKDAAIRDELGRVYAVDFPAAHGLQNVLAAYGASSAVAKVQAVDICKMYDAYLPNDLSSQQYYLRNTNLGSKDVRAVGGWAASLGDSSIIVAITDSGVDWQHPDLGGPNPDHVNGSVWTNWVEYYGTPDVDDDGNGFIDDIRGWDFVDLTSSVQAYPGEDWGHQDNDPMDFAGHGTNCSGCVAPITDNGIGIAATAPGCKIMAVRVGWLDNTGQGVVRMDFCSQGMIYAVNNGAKIINCSWGSTSSLSLAVTTVLSQGGMIFTAAGNDNNSTPSYLGNYNDPRVIAVAATNDQDGKADFSNYGTWVDLCAPGVAIYTTNVGGGYTSTQGTSFSSPIAAGGGALIWSANPGFSASQVSSLLRSSADNVDDANPGYAGMLGSGRVNLLRALGDNVQEVPGEFTLLRDAINEAAVGDTIKVLASEPLATTTFLGKGMKIFGGYAAGYTMRDPIGTPTVITGNSGNPALSFLGTVDNTCEVDGFQIQSGGGRVFSDIPYMGRYGGGIMLNQTSPTLRNLTITGNSVGSSTELGIGGGIATFNSTAVLDNVSITGNSGIYGAGFFAYQSTLTLSNVTIADNPVRTDNGSYAPKGGGMHIIDSTIDLTDCTIDNHVDTDQGGGVYLAGNLSTSTMTMTGGAITGNTAKTNGAGLYASGGSVSLTDVAVTFNTKLETSTFMQGGGIYATGASVQLSGLTVGENTAQIGAGIYCVGCPDVTVDTTLIYNNAADYWAGGIGFDNTVGGQLTNLTVADNTGALGAGGLYFSGGTFDVSNTISANNVGGTTYANGVHANNATLTLACNDVWNNYGADYSGVSDPTGTAGNISEDPLFCDPTTVNYHVSPTSPCAPAQSGGCDLIGALSASCGGTPVEDETPTVPVVFRVDPNFPNPFNPSTTIRFALPVAGHTTVVVYDVAGRRVKTLVDANLPAAEHTVRWTGDDDAGHAVAAGIYFYRVRSGDHEQVERMALVK